jgi:hypothetical protein
LNLWTSTVNLAFVFLFASPAFAEGTRFHSYEGFTNFLEGDAKGTALSTDGEIALAPEAKALFTASEGRISAYAVSGGRTAIALTESGRLSVIDDSGKAQEWGEVPHGVVTAMALDKSALYVATAAPTKLYRFTKPGKPEELPVPKEDKTDVSQIWALALSDKGLLAGTAGPGAVYRWQGKRFEKLFHSSDEIVRSLAVDDHGTIYAGGGTKGIVYRGTDKSFTVLIDTGLDEITQMVPSGGDLFLIGLAGASHDAKGERVAEKGKIRAQLARVDKDGFSDIIAGSDDEILYGLAVGKDGVAIVATGSVDKENPHGRVYSAQPKTRRIAMIYQTKAAMAVGVAARDGAFTIVTNDQAGVEVLQKGLRKEGEFTLPVFDSGTQSHFGAVQLDGDAPKGTQVTVRVRTGETQTPDETWRAWSKELAVGQAVPELAPGRFVQAKVLLHGDGTQTPTARRVRIAFGRQNLSPFVGEVVVLPKGIVLQPLPGDAAHERTLVINDKGFADLKQRPADADAGQKTREFAVPGALTVAWLGQDPNGDPLLYDLYFRAEGDKDFRLLKADLPIPFYSLEGASFADGRYQFRVVARDDESNPPGEGKRDSRDSLWYTFDNTPPRITGLSVHEQRVSFTAEDQASAIVRATYSVDGAPLRPLVSKDGLLDSKQEKFDTALPVAKTNRDHSVSVQVEDEGGNTAAAGTTFKY